MKCKQCNIEFKPVRASAKYCSAKCRVKAGRLSVTDESLSATDKSLSVTVSVTEPEVSVTDNSDTALLPANFGQADCECGHCLNNREGNKGLTINHGEWKPANLLAKHEVNRVSLPSDVDYSGVVVL